MQKEVSVVPTVRHSFQNFAEAEKWAKENIVGEYTNEDTGEVIRVSNKALAKYLSASAVSKSSSRESHFDALAVLPDLIRNGILAETVTDRDGSPDIKALQRFYAAISNKNGEIERVKITVKQYPRAASKAYSYEVSEIETLNTKPKQESDKSRSSSRMPKVSVATLLQGAKRNNGEVWDTSYSQVIDENGEPLVVYHGTDADFDTFNSEFGGKATDGKSAKLAFFFIKNARSAAGYAHHAAIYAPVANLIKQAEQAEARGDYDEYDRLIAEAESLENELDGPKNRGRGQNLIPAFLRTLNPLEVEANGETPDGIGGITPLLNEARRQNNDGVILYDFDDTAGQANDETDHYAVFDSNQIKSAIGNQGTYSDAHNEIFQMAAGEVESPLDAIYNEKGEIDYEQVKDVAERVERGELAVSRLDRSGEQGRIAGGKRALEASIILAADEASRQEASQRGGTGLAARRDAQRRQEHILEQYAKREGIWYDWNKFFKDKHFTRGGEAFVYMQSPTSVAKTVAYRHIDKGLTPQRFLDDRIALYNHIFPGSKYELMGFTKDPEGQFRFLVKQQFFEGYGVSKAEVDAYMQGKGFTPSGRESYSNGLYQVHDVHEKNALKDADGNILVIDAVPKLSDDAYYADFDLEQETGEILEMAAGSENILDSIYNEDGDIDYEQVQNAVDRVLSGEYRIKRLDLAGEEGRTVGDNGLLIGSSLIIGGETRTGEKREARKQRNREEELLEAYARTQNAWVDDIDAFRSSLNYIDRGMEAKVYEDPENPGYALKTVPISFIPDEDSSILRFFDDKIALHNALPNTAPYELVGFARDWNTTSGETFLAILRQPYIKGEETRELHNDFVSQMQADSFVLDYTGSRFTGNGLNVLDITNHNVVKAEDGKYIIFDPIVSYQDNSQYQRFDVETASDEILEMAAGEEPEMTADAYSDFLEDGDFDENGKVKPEALEDIRQDREAIEKQAKADGTWLKAPNGEDSNLTPFQWVEVRTKRFKRWFGDWLAVSKRQALEGQKAVKVNTSAFANAQDAEQRRAVGKIEYRKLVDGKVKVVNKIDGRTIKFTSKQFDKLRSHSAKPDIMQIIPSLPDLLANAVPLYSEPEIDQQKYRNISRWTAYGVKADIDGREVYVGLNTFEVKDGSVYIDIFHDHNTIDAKDLRRLTSKPNSVTNPAASTLPPSSFRLVDWWQKVNENDVSKVVDENGEPLVVYHGSRSGGGFDVFSGIPFFVDNREVAEMFATEGAFTLYVNGESVGVISDFDGREISEGIASYDYEPSEIATWGDFPVNDAQNRDDLVETIRRLTNYQVLSGEIETVRIKPAEDNLYSVFLNIRSPHTSDYKGKGWGDSTEKLPEQIWREQTDNDGIVVTNIVEGGFTSDNETAATDYIPRSPNQIKSATGNQGTYSDAHDEILEMAAGVGFPEAAIRSEIKRFSGEVDKALDKSLPVNAVPEVLSMAPPILVKLGLNEDSIYIPQSVIRKAETTPTSEESKGHNIAPSELKNLPAELNDPVMVFDSLHDPNALVVITNIRNRQGLPVAAVVKYDATLRHETVNLIPTVTDKKGTIFVQDWARKGKARYYNKEKGRMFFKLIGLQLSEVEKTILSTDNILTEEDFVNKSLLKTGEILKQAAGEADTFYSQDQDTEKGRGLWHGQSRLQLPSRMSRRSNAPTNKILTQADLVNEPLFKVGVSTAMRRIAYPCKWRRVMVPPVRFCI